MGDTRTGGFQRPPDQAEAELACGTVKVRPSLSPQRNPADPALAEVPRGLLACLGLLRPAVCLKIVPNKQIGNHSTTDETRKHVCVEITLLV